MLRILNSAGPQPHIPTLFDAIYDGPRACLVYTLLGPNLAKLQARVLSLASR